jgi:cytochrome c-type biogenesis protein CcmF
MLAWKRADLAGALGRLKIAGALSVIIGLGAFYWQFGGPVLAPLGIAFAAWAFFGALTEFAERIRLFRVPGADSWRRAKGLPRSAWGLTIAHAGMGIAVAGMVATSVWKSERIESLAPGDSITTAGYEVTFDGVTSVEGPNYVAERGTLIVRRDGDVVTVLEPEKRWYPVARMPTTEAAIRTTLMADLYAAIGDGPDAEGRWVVRVWHHPLVPWIWAGAIFMALGGLVSLSDRRLRVGAPTRARRAAAPPHPQPAE